MSSTRRQDGMLDRREFIEASSAVGAMLLAPHAAAGRADAGLTGVPVASARLRFDPPQDWSDFNRLSLWCYLHESGNPISSLSIQFLCEGASAGPADPIAVHYIGDLTPGAWNQLVWENPEYRRDRVTELVLFQPLSGVPNLNADHWVIYDLDELQVERVAAEVVQGWQIPQGKIPYKEQWIYASCRAALNLAQLGMPVRLHGVARVEVRLREERTGAALRIAAGRFDRVLPAGVYAAKYGQVAKRLALIGGRNYRVDFNPRSTIAIEFAAQARELGVVELTVRVHGKGRHRLELRTFNLSATRAFTRMMLRQGAERHWTHRLLIVERDEPWTLVVVPDGDRDARQELWGSVSTEALHED